jgi:hypothetical protein
MPTIEETLIALKDRAVSVGAQAVRVAEIMDAWRDAEWTNYVDWCAGRCEWPDRVRLAHADLREMEMGLLSAARDYYDAGVAAVIAEAKADTLPAPTESNVPNPWRGQGATS